MQAFGLSLIKGRLGSDQERREIQTSPERKRARGPVFGAPGRRQDVECRHRGDRPPEKSKGGSGPRASCHTPPRGAEKKRRPLSTLRFAPRHSRDSQRSARATESAQKLSIASAVPLYIFLDTTSYRTTSSGFCLLRSYRRESVPERDGQTPRHRDIGTSSSLHQRGDEPLSGLPREA
jgi:hypothetical protein